MFKLTRLILPLLALWLIIPTQAQEARIYTDIESLPSSVKLDGLTQIWQGFNRCSAAALTTHLSYFEDVLTDGVYNDMVRRLNPYAADVSVRIEEMAAAAEERGLKAVVRRGGTVDLLKQLVASGFPVLIENVYFDGPNGWQDWMSHNRVLMGYDDSISSFYFYDPLLGAGDNREGYSFTYEEIDERWRPFNRDYMVIYRPEQEEAIQQILAEQWDINYNWEWTQVLAQAEIDADVADSFTYYNLGSAQVELGLYEEAAASYDQAREIGMPFRMYWYEFGPFEAYLEVGRYDDTLELARTVISDAEGVEEAYYYAGRAYEGLGDTQRAINNYEAALFRNRFFAAPAQRLGALSGG